MPPKPFNAPFWITLVMAILLGILSYYTYVSIENFNQGSFPSRRVIHLSLLSLLFWPILLTCEAVIYRIIRKKIVSRAFVWFHLVSLFIAFGVLPTIPPVMGFLAEHFSLSLNAFNVYDRVKPPATLAILIIGHAFFIATIAKSLHKKATSAADNEQTTGILTGIVDERQGL